MSLFRPVPARPARRRTAAAAAAAFLLLAACRDVADPLAPGAAAAAGAAALRPAASPHAIHVPGVGAVRDLGETRPGGTDPWGQPYLMSSTALGVTNAGRVVVRRGSSYYLQPYGTAFVQIDGSGWQDLTNLPVFLSFPANGPTYSIWKSYAPVAVGMTPAGQALGSYLTEAPANTACPWPHPNGCSVSPGTTEWVAGWFPVITPGGAWSGLGSPTSVTGDYVGGNGLGDLAGRNGSFASVLPAGGGSAAAFQTLTVLPGYADRSTATAINDQRQVVGTSGHDWQGPSQGTVTNGGTLTHAFYWDASSGMVDVHPGAYVADARAINASGVVVGCAYQSSFSADYDYGYVWKKGSPAQVIGGCPKSINAKGEIVGQYQGHAAYWSPVSRTWYFLGDLPAGDASDALGINDNGDIVGWSRDGVTAPSAVPGQLAYETRAVAWRVPPDSVIARNATMDIQPNAISLSTAKTISVYVYGSATFDATKIVPAATRLTVTQRPASTDLVQVLDVVLKSGVPMTTVKDFNGDGIPDRMLVYPATTLQAAGMQAMWWKPPTFALAGSTTAYAFVASDPQPPGFAQ